MQENIRSQYTGPDYEKETDTEHNWRTQLMQKGLNLTQSSAFKKDRSRVIGFLTVDLGRV